MRSGYQVISPELPELVGLARVDPQARGEQLLLQALGPAAVGQELLRGLGGEAGDDADLGRHDGAAYEDSSSSSVTGPSLTSSTSMCAPNRPPCAPSRARKRS